MMSQSSRTRAAATEHLSTNSHSEQNLSEPERRRVHENRMDRPPYAPAAHVNNPNNNKKEEEGGQFKEEEWKKVYDGECFCGAVKFELSREAPLDAKFCHCGGCQVLHGAPFQAAIFHKTDMLFTSGKEQLIYWNSSEKSQDYILPCKVSCKTCRTPIMDEGRNMVLLFPTLIQFPDHKAKQKFHPSCHIFYQRRSVDVPDGLPKWAGHKNESELVDETMDTHAPDGAHSLKI